MEDVNMTNKTNNLPSFIDGLFVGSSILLWICSHMLFVTLIIGSKKCFLALMI